jgi:hypothetical protein
MRIYFLKEIHNKNLDKEAFITNGSVRDFGSVLLSFLKTVLEGHHKPLLMTERL